MGHRTRCERRWLGALVLTTLGLAPGCIGAGLPLGLETVHSAFSSTPALVTADAPLSDGHVGRDHPSRASYSRGANRWLVPFNLISAVTLGAFPATTILEAEGGEVFLHEEWLPLWFPYHTCCITLSFPFDVGFPRDEAAAALLRQVGNGSAKEEERRLLDRLGLPGDGSIAAFLDDPSPRVRAEAALALARRARRGWESAEPLCAHLDDGGERVRLSVEQAIAASHPSCAPAVERRLAPRFTVTPDGAP